MLNGTGVIHLMKSEWMEDTTPPYLPNMPNFINLSQSCDNYLNNKV